LVSEVRGKVYGKVLSVASVERECRIALAKADGSFHNASNQWLFSAYFLGEFDRVSYKGFRELRVRVRFERGSR
jgi:hypothetical protein